MSHEAPTRTNRPQTLVGTAVDKPADRIIAKHFMPRLQTNRPMLSRVAEAMYWMSRYVERAEHIARIVRVNSHLLIDLGELAPDMQEKQWLGVLRILRLDSVQEKLKAEKGILGQNVSNFMAFGDSNRSLISCLTRARENARSIRENISAEMWENLNTLYWSLQGEDTKQRFEDFPQEMFHSVIMGSLLFQGVADQTLPHGQGWHFIQLAKYLERADMICRILDTKFDILAASAELNVDTPLRNIQCMGVLRTCCSIEAYQRKYLADLDPRRIAEFLLFDGESPRNVRFSIRAAREALSGIAGNAHPQQLSAAERTLGRLNAHLEHAEPDEIARQSLKPFLKEVQDSIASASLAIENAYFLH